MSDKYYYWRLAGKKGNPGSWNEVTDEKFKELLRAGFFGASTVSDMDFQGRILSAPKIDVELITSD